MKYPFKRIDPDTLEDKRSAWHFLKNDGRTEFGGNIPPDDGDWWTVAGTVTLCCWGLHASERLRHALAFAPGDLLCRVECADIGGTDQEKIVARHRKIVWRVDAAQQMRAFMRRVALDVADLWDAPEIAREVLKAPVRDEGPLGIDDSPERKLACRIACEAANYKNGEATARNSSQEERVRVMAAQAAAFAIGRRSHPQARAVHYTINAAATAKAMAAGEDLWRRAWEKKPILQEVTKTYGDWLETEALTWRPDLMINSAPSADKQPMQNGEQ